MTDQNSSSDESVDSQVYREDMKSEFPPPLSRLSSLVARAFGFPSFRVPFRISLLAYPNRRMASRRRPR